MQCCRSQKKCNFGRNNTLYTIHSQRLLTRLKRWWRGSFPPPVRHARQKMKAFRTCLHSQLSVSSTQAGVDQIRGEFGWTVVLRREKGGCVKRNPLGTLRKRDCSKKDDPPNTGVTWEACVATQTDLDMAKAYHVWFLQIRDKIHGFVEQAKWVKNIFKDRIRSSLELF